MVCRGRRKECVLFLSWCLVSDPWEEVVFRWVIWLYAEDNGDVICL